MSSLSALSPLDGRYQGKTEALRAYFSESALMKYRVKVEVEWFVFLCNQAKLVNTEEISEADAQTLRNLYLNFDEKSAETVKDTEKTTNHDVKAIEYFIKDNLPAQLANLKEFIHFGCTSEDINNLSYALMIKDAGNELLLPTMHELVGTLFELAKQHKSAAMLSRTHGQPASPTTMGKELINVVARLERQYSQLDKCKVMGKINGAVGNFNAHVAAYPDVNWKQLSVDFVEGVLGLEQQSYTTQIEPHDYMAEIFHNMMRFNTILIDLSRDVWMYISYKFFKQKLKVGEIGSSTMPHKVNPIDFENGEGNLGLANAIFSHMAEKLPISRMQRDLSDSTVQRNIGTAFAYSVMAYKAILKGLNKLELNEQAMLDDLGNNWEVLAEPIQMVMRKYNVENAYEKLKEFSRGKKVDQTSVAEFVKGLGLPQEEIDRLLELTPAKYIGLAENMVDDYELWAAK